MHLKQENPFSMAVTVVHKEVMDTTRHKKKNCHSKYTYLAILSKKALKQKEKNTRKITVFMHLLAKNMQYRGNIFKRTL
jgi:ribosomal protein L3